MLRSMPTRRRPQRRYDHRLRNLVQRTGDVTVATDLGVPLSTARGWLAAAPTVVVCLDVADLPEPELRQEVRRSCGDARRSFTELGGTPPSRKSTHVIEGGDERRGGDRPDAGTRGQSLNDRVVGDQGLKLRIGLRHFLVEDLCHLSDW